MYFQELKAAVRRQDEKRTFLWKEGERMFVRRDEEVKSS
jgi:hypothetical protein